MNCWIKVAIAVAIVAFLFLLWALMAIGPMTDRQDAEARSKEF